MTLSVLSCDMERRRVVCTDGGAGPLMVSNESVELFELGTGEGGTMLRCGRGERYPDASKPEGRSMMRLAGWLGFLKTRLGRTVEADEEREWRPGSGGCELAGWLDPAVPARCRAPPPAAVGYSYDDLGVLVGDSRQMRPSAAWARR